MQSSMLSLIDSRQIVRQLAARFVVRIVVIPGFMMTTMGNMERFSTCVAYAQGLTATITIIEEFTSAVYVIEHTAQNVRRWFRAGVPAYSIFSVRIAHLILATILIVQRSFAMIVR